MQRYILISLLVVALSMPAFASGAERSGCAPGYRALYDNAVVELNGTGELDIVVVTDPLCWHCRLGHKLLGEYPDQYRSLRLCFYPRPSYIGSDMAAWVLEDAAGTDRLKALVDYAYSKLKAPRTDDLMQARMLILMQFTEAFPGLLKETTLPELAVRLQKQHEPHTMMTVELAKAVDLPGTPVLIAGDAVLVGYGPGPWLDVLKEKKICK